MGAFAGRYSDVSNSLFLPDIFSRNVPEFKSCSDDTTAEVIEVLKHIYKLDVPSGSTIEKLVGLEINSKNYRITLPSRQLALKQTNRINENATVANQLALSQLLLERGINFPRLLRSHEGDYVSVHNNSSWILGDFVSGKYYSGQNDESAGLGVLLGSMQGILDNLDVKDLPVSNIVSNWQETRSVFAEFYKMESDWPHIFPAQDYLLLNDNYEALRKSIDVVEDFKATVIDRPVVTHIDLHPHNILVNNSGKLIVLDVDSLQVSYRLQSIAFAFYKLMRQHVISNKIGLSVENIGNAVQGFAMHYSKGCKLDKSDFGNLQSAAMVEVVRRIGIIIRLNMVHRNTEWNRVLIMHMSALAEIPYLFSCFDNR